jgi:putative N-acetylmannosamine-6-phosphate epimerase
MEINFSQGHTVYLIDTSGLIKLESTFKPENPVYTAVWEEIEDLIKQGFLKTIDFVETEINEYEGKEEFLKKWIKKWKRIFVVETDVESFNAAIPICDQEYQTGFFNAKKQAEGKEEADAYLIGYCIAHNCVLITNEGKYKSNKIPAVAKKHGVWCIDVDEFLMERGLKMERKK